MRCMKLNMLKITFPTGLNDVQLGELVQEFQQIIDKKGYKASFRKGCTDMV